MVGVTRILGTSNPECTMMSWIELLHRCSRFVANAAAAGLPASSCTAIMSATSPDPGLHHHHHHGFGLPHLLYPTCYFLTKDFSNLAAIITSMDQVPHCAVAVAATKIADLPHDEFVAAVAVAKKVADLSPDEFVVAIGFETMTTDLPPDKFCLLILRLT
ncbi:unnamed protein product [Sphagnum balticum]